MNDIDNEKIPEKSEKIVKSEEKSQKSETQRNSSQVSQENNVFEDFNKTQKNEKNLTPVSSGENKSDQSLKTSNRSKE